MYNSPFFGQGDMGFTPSPASLYYIIIIRINQVYIIFCNKSRNEFYYHIDGNVIYLLYKGILIADKLASVYPTSPG